MNNIWETILFLIPILCISVYSLALILQKHRQLSKHPPLEEQSFLDFLAEISQVGGVSSLTMEKMAGHPLLLVVQGKGKKSLAQSYLSIYEDRISFLPSLANVATLLGLFGTVCGMIISFLALRSGGGADPSALAGGISQSLLATAFGLIAAIPCLLAYTTFQRKADRMAAQLERVLEVLPVEDSHGN